MASPKHALLPALLLTLSLSTADASPRGTYIEFADAAEPDTGPSVLAAKAPWILYLNRQGGTYSPAHHNDSRTNTSIVPSSPSQIPAWNVDADDWADVVGCVHEQFDRWDIEVTDVNPGNKPHFEAVVGGGSDDLGLPSGIGGVSPFRSNCSLIDNSIVFVFPEAYGDNHRGVCETIAQEIGHSIGLDHSYLCEDPMTYLGGCGEKSFQDADVACGEGSARPCACGGATQNSVATFDARLGVFGGPRFQIASPSDGSKVPSGFMIVGQATDDDGVDNVVLEIDGVAVDESDAPSFAFKTPALSLGDHVVEIIATDSKGKLGRQRLTITVEAGAPDPAAGVDDLGPMPISCSASGGAPGPGSMIALFVLAGLLGRRRLRITS